MAMSWHEAQQLRWLQPSAHRFIRHDAYRFMAPGSAHYTGADVVKYFAPEAKYSEDQPRVPAGSSEGGQWTAGEGGAIELDEILVQERSGDFDDALDDEFDQLWDELFPDGLIRLAGDIPTGDPPEIPRQRPPRARDRIRIARALVRALRSPRSSVFWLGVDFGSWIYEHSAEINSYFDPPLDELTAAAQNPAEGYDRHHIVEQAAGKRLGLSQAEIDKPENVVAIPRWKHWQLNGWYQTRKEAYSWMTPREYLIGKT